MISDLVKFKKAAVDAVVEAVAPVDATVELDAPVDAHDAQDYEGTPTDAPTDDVGEADAPFYAARHTDATRPVHDAESISIKNKVEDAPTDAISGREKEGEKKEKEINKLPFGIHLGAVSTGENSARGKYSSGGKENLKANLKQQ